jgi:hypothetical protein
MTLAAVLVALASLPAVAPAPDDVAPTKNQRESLAILVTAWSDRLATHAESLEKEVIERALRKALYNQVSYRAEAAFHDALVELLMADRDLKTSDGRRAVERELVDPWRAAAVLDSERFLDRFGFKSQHLSVLMHRPEILAGLRALHDAHQVEEEQAKALATLAELCARRMIDIVAEPGEKKVLIELCAEVLVTRDTERALVGVRNKARGLLRRRAIGAQKLKDDLEKLALDALLDEQMPQAFPATFWHELRFDHQRCLERPAEHRKVLQDLLRDKKRPDDATPPPLEPPEDSGVIEGGGTPDRG